MEDHEVLRLQPLISRPSTVDEETRTVELEIATEAPVNGLVLRCSSESVVHAPVVSVLLDHKNETSAMAGRMVSIRAEAGRLVGLAQFTDAPAAETGWQLARSGCPTSVRAVYRLSDVQMGSRDEPDVVTRWRLGEVSLTPMGADLTATRTAGSAGDPADTQVRSDESPNMKHETALTQDSPMDETRKQEAPAEAPGAEAGAETETRNSTAGITLGVDVQSADQIRAGERRRVTDIMDACRKANLDGTFAEKLIADGIQIDAARAAILDAMYERQQQQPQTQARIDVTRDHGEKRSEAMLHALEARSGMRSWDEGGAREYLGTTLLDMGRECLERSGVSTRGMTKSEVAIRAMHSTTDFPLLLTSIQRVTLKAAYAEERQTWQSLARQDNLPDFRDMSVMEVGGSMLPEELREGGEYKAGTISETKGSWKLSEYGKKLVVGRRLIINDNLGYITRAIQVLGRGVAVFEANQMWGLITTGSLGATCMMDSKALFHADHANTGTGVIGEASISDARQKMRNQKSFDGTPLYVNPQYILIPTTLETAFDKFNTTIVANQTSNVNIFSGYLQKIVEPRLDAKSTTQFYVVGDYPGVDKLVYGYLDGEGGPSIESVSGRDPDGVTVYLRHTFGCTVPQHQWIYRSTGA